MSTRLRLNLVVIGLIIIFCALIAITYTFWPLPGSGLESTLAPTLLTPP